MLKIFALLSPKIPATFYTLHTWHNHRFLIKVEFDESTRNTRTLKPNLVADHHRVNRDHLGTAFRCKKDDQ